MWHIGYNVVRGSNSHKVSEKISLNHIAVKDAHVERLNIVFNTTTLHCSGG